MKNFYPLYKKELRTYFTSPIAYMMITVFSVLSGYLFYGMVKYHNMMSQYSNRRHQTWEKLSFSDGILKPMMDNISLILLFVVPLLTMRLFAEEKKSGTIELLFTYPLKDEEIIAGKFLASLTVLLSMFSITVTYPVMLSFFGEIEWGVVFSGYLGLLLLGMAFLSIGIMVSAMTENQIIAGAGSFGMLLFFWVIGMTKDTAGPGGINSFLNYLSLTEHFSNFSKGIISTVDLVFYLIFISFPLFMTYGILGSKKWRG